MSESNSGFSFGAAPERDGAPGEVDAIEVSGEPVSRSEAKNMGFAQFDSTKEAKSSSSLFRQDQLPSNLSDELAKKLEKAWQHLKRNEIDEALTLAQEVVWESPDLVAPKLVIARCFINRKEYTKAINILQAIPESDSNAEIMYYSALCLSRLGKVKEAIDTLKMAKASSGDAIIRKRANDLLLHLQGEQTVCPICGKKTLYDSMVDVGDQTVCANCAKNMPDEDDEDDDEDDEDDEEEWEEEGGSGKRRKKRLRPPLTKTDILVRIIFCLLLAGFLLLGLYMMSFVAPSHYVSIRQYLPDSWTFLPPVGNVTPISEIRGTPAGQNSQPQPTVNIDSPLITKAVAGVELRHQVLVRNMEKRDGVYKVTFSPEPANKYRFDDKTGELTWTPAEQDAGKVFTVTFGAAFTNILAKNQVNKVAVSSGPRFRNLHSLLEPRPGQIVHLLAEDLGGDEHPEIIAVTGMYWQGQITAFEEGQDGFLQPVSRTLIPGRPAGAGVVMADGEKWLAIADYWNSRLRHYALRDGNLSEMAIDVDLPGRPLLAGFDRDSSTSVVVCRGDDRIDLVCYRQEGQLRNSKIGEWPLPDDFVWKRILVLPGDEAENRRPVPVIIGGEPAESIFLVDLKANTLVPMKLNIPGSIIDAVVDVSGRIHCLVESQGELRLVGFNHSFTGEAQKVTVSEVGPSLVNGLVTADFVAEEGRQDLIVFSPDRLGIAFAMDDERDIGLNWWDLPKPSRLFGDVVAAPGSNGRAARVFYIDSSGDLWRVGVVTPEVGK